MAVTVYEAINPKDIWLTVLKYADELRTDSILVFTCPEKEIQIQLNSFFDFPSLSVISGDKSSEEIYTVSISASNATAALIETVKRIFGEEGHDYTMKPIAEYNAVIEKEKKIGEVKTAINSLVRALGIHSTLFKANLLYEICGELGL